MGATTERNPPALQVHHDGDDPHIPTEDKAADGTPTAPPSEEGGGGAERTPLVQQGDPAAQLALRSRRPADGRIDTTHSRTYPLKLVCNLAPIALGVAALVAFLVNPGGNAATAKYIGGGAAFAYLVYVIHACCSGSAQALRNEMPIDACASFVASTRGAAPVITFSVHCWCGRGGGATHLLRRWCAAPLAAALSCRHTETRHRTVTTRNKDGSHSTRTETYTVTVTTFRETERWAYGSWTDTSYPPPDFADLGPVRLKNTQVGRNAVACVFGNPTTVGTRSLIAGTGLR